MKAIIETWNINNRINLYLLEAIEDKWLADTASSKGRTVGDQFAHIHNVRLMWLKEAAPDLQEGLTKIENGTATVSLLKKALAKSGKAIGKMIEKGFESGQIKGFKPHPEAYLGYIISHESHHRGQIVLSLKQSNHMPSKKTLFGLWEWGSRFNEI